MNVLVGKTILEIKVAGDRKAILFRTDAGDIVAKADGDCCSCTWIEHVEMPARGFPALVQSVDDLDMPGSESKDDYEVTAFYGCKITTSNGDIVIDYRNESNGYYGGSLSWPGDYFYGGVHGQNISSEEWAA